MMKTRQSEMEMCFYCEEAGGQTQFVSCKNKVIILTALELKCLSVLETETKTIIIHNPD